MRMGNEKVVSFGFDSFLYSCNRTRTLPRAFHLYCCAIKMHKVDGGRALSIEGLFPFSVSKSLSRALNGQHTERHKHAAFP